MRSMSKPGIRVSVVLLVALLLGGCYWTPEVEEGGVTLNINGGNIGTSQIGGFDGFFFGYVIAGDLLRGDQAAADRAFEEVGAALEAAFQEIESPEDLDEFELYLTFPAVQLQAEYFVGSSGSNTFGGLRAGREYLVVLKAFDFNNTSQDYNGDMGFSAVTIEGGEAKPVNLELGNNWSRFYEFMERRYGYAAETGAVEITMPTDYQAYVDLLVGSTTYTSGQDFGEWYFSADVVVVNKNHEPIQKVNNRPAVPFGTVTYRIDGLPPGKSWRILFTNWADRSITGTNSGHLSIPFTTSEAGTTYLDFSILSEGPDFEFVGL